MIQIQGRHIRFCGAILAAVLLGVAGASVDAAPSDTGDGGSAVSARGSGKTASRGSRSAGGGKAASRGSRSAGRGKAASRGGRSAGRGKPAPTRSGRSAGRATGSRDSGRNARPAPRRQPQPPKANRSPSRRTSGREASPAPRRETRPSPVRRTGGQRDVTVPRKTTQRPRSTTPRRVTVIRPGSGERPSSRTPRIDPRKTAERRVSIVRPGEGTRDRREPEPGPGVTDRKVPTTTITFRPGSESDDGPTTQSIPRRQPGDAGGTTPLPRTRSGTGARPRVSIIDPGSPDDGPITQSIPRRLPGDAGGTSTSPRRPSGTGARPRVSIGDPGPNDGGGGSTKGGKGKKGGQQGRHKGGGHKGHDKHRHGRRHHDYSWCWYWGWYWCYPGYRYSWYCGWPWYGYWPSFGRYGWRYRSWYGSWPYDDGYSYSSSDYGAQPAYADYSDGAYTQIVYAPEPCPQTLAEAWGLLADSRSGEAADAFDCLADAIPDDGLPLVGYALAAALLDEHEVAVANMREALRADPESLRYVPDDERLHGQLMQLVEHYEYRARHQYGDLDALFMVASLWYLLNQEQAAGYAIDVAITLGDRDASALGLRSLIESALE